MRPKTRQRHLLAWLALVAFTSTAASAQSDGSDELADLDEFEPDVVNKFYRMTAEATACGLFFACWWRYSHVQEKNRYDRYYASIKAEADDEE